MRHRLLSVIHIQNYENAVLIAGFQIQQTWGNVITHLLVFFFIDNTFLLETRWGNKSRVSQKASVQQIHHISFSNPETLICFGPLLVNDVSVDRESYV